MIPQEKLIALRNEFEDSINDGIYVNHAAISPLPKCVVSEVRQHLETRISGKIDDLEYVMEQLDQARTLVSHWLHAERATSVAFVPNTSSGITYVASSFPFEKGDEILLYDREFPTNSIPYERLQAFGVNVRKCSSATPWITADQLLEHVRPATKIIAVSAVQFLSGYKIDLKKLGEFCRSTGRFLLVDAIQAAGVVPFDVQEMKIDGWVAGSHKWLCAPDGIGILYVSDRLNERLTPNIAGWLSIEEPWSFFQSNPSWLKTTGRFEMGTLNLGGIRALHRSISLLQSISDSERYHSCVHLGKIIRKKLQNSDILTLYSPANPEERAGILTYRLPKNMDPQRFMKGLKDRSITASIREGNLRLSPHVYQTEEEMEILSEGILSLLDEMR